MYLDELKIGMTLYCDDGCSTVKLCEIQKDTIIVQYKGKRYSRPISIIGKRLFVEPVVIEKATEKPNEQENVEDNSARYGSTMQVVDGSTSDSRGYDSDGYDKNGFDANGFDRAGYDSRGYDREGYNRFGYDIRGYDCDGYDRYGYDESGFNRYGYDCDGFDVDGYDRSGYNGKGYNRAGYNRNGYDLSGYNRAGYDRHGFDKNGYDKNGYDSQGYDKDGYNKFDVDKNLTARPGSILDTKLFPRITKLYHKVYGEGLLISLDINAKGVHMCVKFNSDTKTFVYPNCFSDGHLKLEKTPDMCEFEEFISTPSGRRIYEEEKKFLKTISDSIKNDVVLAERNHTDAVYSLRDLDDDSWSSELSEELKIMYSSTHREQLKMYSVRREPYFARVDAGKSSLYIGKNEYKNIIEWTDPRASLYYEYQMYIANAEHKLSLVRDLKVYQDIICFIRDKYNQQIGENGIPLQSADGVISDPNLLMIINANRDNKSVHDIIASIQNNQYKIITKDLDGNMVVSGCAGSGKTMIMLHRLRYLLRNNKELSPRKIAVLSPTDALARENSQLAMMLGMGDIGVFSNRSLYALIYEMICRQNGWGVNNKKISYLANDIIDTEQIKEIYSTNTLDYIYKKISEIVFNQKEKNAYLAAVFKEIRSKKIDFLGLAYLEAKEKHLFERLDSAASHFVRFKEISGKISVENVEEFMKHNAANGGINDERREARGKALALLLEHAELLSNRTLYKTQKSGKEEIIQDDSDILKPLYDFLEQIHWGDTEAYCGAEDPIDMFDEYYLPLSQHEQRLMMFKAGNDYACLVDIVDFVVMSYKKEKNIPRYYRCEWELFVAVQVLSRFLQFSFDGSELVLVDEYQDYSICELEFLDKVFDGAVFNYFGDPAQAISAKSSSKELLMGFFEGRSAEFYSINENYRNAMEITEHVNSEMKMSMRPVGISGQVMQIRLSESSKIDIGEDDRVALICKKENAEKLYEYLMHDLGIKCNFISEQGVELRRGEINVIAVSLSKGLEFEKVIAVTERMSFAERYVTFTRALNELYIVKGELSV